MFSAVVRVRSITMPLRQNFRLILDCWISVWISVLILNTRSQYWISMLDFHAASQALCWRLHRHAKLGLTDNEWNLMNFTASIFALINQTLSLGLSLDLTESLFDLKSPFGACSTRESWSQTIWSQVLIASELCYRFHNYPSLEVTRENLYNHLSPQSLENVQTEGKFHFTNDLRVTSAICLQFSSSSISWWALMLEIV